MSVNDLPKIIDHYILIRYSTVTVTVVLNVSFIYIRLLMRNVRMQCTLTQYVIHNVGNDAK